MQQHLTQYRMSALCEALQVSRSGFHAWRVRPVKERRLQLSTAVATCHTQHQARAGAPSIAADIKEVNGVRLTAVPDKFSSIKKPQLR